MADLLSLPQVADLLGVTPQTVRAYWTSGRMPPPEGQIGRAHYWSRATVLAWDATVPADQRSRRGRGGITRAAMDRRTVLLRRQQADTA